MSPNIRGPQCPRMIHLHKKFRCIAFGYCGSCNTSSYSDGIRKKHMGYCFMQKAKRLVALEGKLPIVASHGAEIETYNTLHPGVRVLILKALCDILVEPSQVEYRAPLPVKPNNHLRIPGQTRSMQLDTPLEITRNGLVEEGGAKAELQVWGVMGKYAAGELKPPSLVMASSRGSGKHPQLMPSTPRWVVANGAGVILSVCDEEVARYETATLTVAAVPALLLPPPTTAMDEHLVAGLPALEPYARLFYRYYDIASPSATQRLLLGLLEAPPSWAPDALDAAVQLVELLRAAGDYASGMRAS
ncbi:unnamed protein product [Lactuca virosa]|uniref:Uncharacterized protein n=1 Tax=Lactuca virosa TaxID=75947 RepID=A0AAU9LI11_9ASTR|nr:unnamed protein product [Lactuca virosa]